MIRTILTGLLLAFLIPSAITQTTSMPNGLPADFPIPPKTDKSLFFIQRNKNKNTVVYDANLSGGKFNASKPIEVYWLRYGSNGARAELTWLQRNFAFGYASKKDDSGNGFWITLSAYDKRRIHLEKTADGRPIATITINGKYCQLTNIWVYATENSTWRPTVHHVDLHGMDMVSGKVQVERIKN